MILYVGNKYEHFFLQDICPEEDIEVIEGIIDIKDLVYPATEKAYTHIVINITLLVNEVSVIVNNLSKIKEINNSNIILYAMRTPPTSTLIQGLYFAGFKNFILSHNLAEVKEECTRCMNGYYDVHPVAFEDDIAEEQPTTSTDISVEEIRQAQKRKLTIGVAGCCHRIGTTTQVLQVCKYLQFQGYSVAAIEVNQSGYMYDYVSSLLDETEYSYSKESGMIRYANIDIYTKADFIPVIKKKPYDYFVYDFGCYFDDTFNDFGFWDKDYNILVCGLKPGEADGTTNILAKTLDRTDCNYIFSFLPKDGSFRKDVLDLMEEKAAQTSFGNAVFNPFVFSSSNKDTYEKIFNTAIKAKKVQQEKKKKSLFSVFSHSK